MPDGPRDSVAFSAAVVYDGGKVSVPEYGAGSPGGERITAERGKMYGPRLWAIHGGLFKKETNHAALQHSQGRDGGGRRPSGR